MGFQEVTILYKQKLFSSSACELVGPGGCRGAGWDSGDPKSWPKSVPAPAAGDADGCCKRCLETKGCTAFHVTAADKKKNVKGASCLLFGHADVNAVERLGGKCYRVNRVPDKGGKKSRGTLCVRTVRYGTVRYPAK